MSILFSPLTIRGVTLRNRIVMSPMCQYSATDGFACDWHMTHYGSRAIGGAGLIIFEATGVAPEGRITPGDLGLWSDDHVDGLHRIRLLVEVADAVRSVWPEENPVFTRISSTDYTEDGWTIGESVRLAEVLKNHGVDLVDCSSGGNVHDAVIPFGPGYQVQFSEAVRKTGILTSAVGLITSSRQAEAILSEGKADLVFMGRELLRNPYFPLHAARELDANVSWPVQYLRAAPKK